MVVNRFCTPWARKRPNCVSSYFNGALWTPNVRVKNQARHGAPALETYGGRLQLVHLGTSSNQLWHSIFDGTWRPNVQVEDQSSSVGVGLAVFRDQLIQVHVGSDSTRLWHSAHTR